MKVVGVRELKDRLSEYLRLVRQGEEVLVTDRGEVVAALRDPGASIGEVSYPGLRALVRQGRVRQGLENQADLYPDLPPLLPRGETRRLLEAERGPH